MPWVGSLEMAGVDTSTSGITLLPGSGTANSKNATYTQLIGSTADATDAISAQIDYEGPAISNDVLLDVATGAGGAEVVKTANLLFGCQGTGGCYTPLLLPLAIAGSTRIAATSQRNSTGTTSAFGIALLLYQGGTFITGVSSTTTYGANTADSGGVDLDPGGSANTKSGYTEVTAATSEDATWLNICWSNQDVATAASANWLTDVATGAGGAEVVQVANLCASISAANDDILGGHCAVPVATIASGTRLSANTQSTNTAAGSRHLDIVIVAANLGDPAS